MDYIIAIGGVLFWGGLYIVLRPTQKSGRDFGMALTAVDKKTHQACARNSGEAA